MGVVYIVIGVLAVLAALNRWSQPADFGGAVEALCRTPVGTALAAAVVAGLACHALWLFVRAILDPDHCGTGVTGCLSRTGSFASAVVYVGMAYTAFRLLHHHPLADPGGNASARGGTAAVMAHPAGRWVIAAVALAIGGYGAFDLYRAWWADFDGRLDLHRLPLPLRRCAVQGSRLGMVARAIALLVVAAFLVAAAYHDDPNAARGLGGALAYLRCRPAGPFVLGLIAWGLVSYGLHNFILACFRRFQPAEAPKGEQDAGAPSAAEATRADARPLATTPAPQPLK